ncbi:Signal recognition particle subunit SRP68 [Sphaceloma murrayae]|uniref:ubiquitinyl hydrolase 1 n=1 Tax=Sphaceloma murrayae TaxID=2082308 RepID=A0A2K1QQE3_9PEZI|nr:Signal recognition particle subunit SRP68 [Sphaceloma murrayae]
MEILKELFNHVVLPCELPGREDSEPQAVADGLVTRLIDACGVLLDSLGNDEDQVLLPTLRNLKSTLKNAATINGGRLDKDRLTDTFVDLKQNSNIIIHVTQQNAALLIRRICDPEMEPAIIIEAFETSAPAATVLECNALQWDFPGRAVRLDESTFRGQAFQDSLTTFLERASMESLQVFQASVTKAGTRVTEVRDTTSPALISQMLMSLLEAKGSLVEVPVLRKRVRDDVNFSHAKVPWRRHPFWLVLRVAVQRLLCLALGAKVGRAWYKLLVGVVHSRLLRDITGRLSPEQTHALKAKLCRRMAKLESEMPASASSRILSADIFSSIQHASQSIESAWTNFNTRNLRPVPSLSRKADARDTRVALLNSGQYLEDRLAAYQLPALANLSLREASSAELTKLSKAQKVAEKYMGLSKVDQAAYLRSRNLLVGDQHDLQCQELAHAIIRYKADIGDAYAADPQQMSLMLLNIFELWIAMDTAALKACPLLRSFHPVFTPKLLDCLQLPRFSHMKRLQDVQTYLATRLSSSPASSTPDNAVVPRSIFSMASGRHCFNYRYFNTSSTLQSLMQRITNASNNAKEQKRQEWKEKWTKYIELSEKIERGTCTCSINADGTRNVKSCAKCYYWRTRNRLEITVHEDYLPSDKVAAAIIVCELGMPEYLRQYRDATWMIIRDIAYPSRFSKRPAPVLSLQAFGQLKGYQNTTSRVTMASSVKSHLDTHYRMSQGNASERSVLKPIGPRFEFFDATSNDWLDDSSGDSTRLMSRRDSGLVSDTKPPPPHLPLTLQHHTGTFVPKSLSSVLPAPAHPATFGHGDKLSSYQIQANRATCPKQMPVHEFSAQQKLLETSDLRWLSIITELGASNLNFGSSDTMRLISELSVQAGPNAGDSVLRDYHAIFADPSFVNRLIEQIQARLDSISTNRGELYCMELCINLSLRLLELVHGESQQLSAMTLVASARTIALDWTRQFRGEFENAIDAESAKTSALNAAWAALLCRKTFDDRFMSSRIIAEQLAVWAEVSISLQDGLPAEINTMPPIMQGLFIRDARFGWCVARDILQSVERHPEALTGAILRCIEGHTAIEGLASAPSNAWTPVPSHVHSWIATTIIRQGHTDIFCFNVVSGRLLINGKALGSLPPEIADSPDVRELFGDRHLLVYASAMPGMTYRLSRDIEGHVIHFGIMGSEIVIRAVFSNSRVLEFVPRRKFLSADTLSWDLPKELIDCVQWLNLRTREVEFRRKPEFWRLRPRDWKLDVQEKRITRGDSIRWSTLICPESALFRRLRDIFLHFEDPFRMTVYVSQHMFIFVHLRELELSFRVNERGLLECKELHAEIDVNQDAGTMYGFLGKLVVKDYRTGQRSLLVPLGKPIAQRHGVHVWVRADTASGYAKYEIDNILGRLSCAPEPRLLYAKALLHAMTSFPVPDPLTGKTGTQEALSILSSAAAQPWAPLSQFPINSLQLIQSLSPSREYYPRNLKKLQITTWNDDLTCTIQHDALDQAVQEILDKSSCVDAFSKCDDNFVTTTEVSHLRRRGEQQRLLYERHNPRKIPSGHRADIQYRPRDRETGSTESSEVFAITSDIEKKPFQTSDIQDYQHMLCGWPLIGGVGDNTEVLNSSLASLLTCNIAEHWIGLVDLCAASNTDQLAFVLGVLAYNPGSTQQALRHLAAYGSIDDLKALDIPEHSSFTDYRSSGPPTTEEAVACITKHFNPFLPDPMKRKALRNAERREHEQRCLADASAFVQRLLRQWPSPTLQYEEPGFVTSFDVEDASATMLTEWQRRLRNTELQDYVEKAQLILDRHHFDANPEKPTKSRIVAPAFDREHKDTGPRLPIQLPDLFRQSAPNQSRSNPINDDQVATLLSALVPSVRGSASIASGQDSAMLKDILVRFGQSADGLRQQYSQDLLSSLEAVNRTRKFEDVMATNTDIGMIIRRALRVANDRMDQKLAGVRSLIETDVQHRWLLEGQLWPADDVLSLLSMLRSTVTPALSSDAKQVLIAFADAVTQAQRLKRMYAAYCKEDFTNVKAELNNSGHENWDPASFPDWALMEIDSNILIRAEQVDVARAIVNPTSGKNSVLQMNMGKGKTSCIVPMAMALLADGMQLTRLIVPRALIFQTAQVLQTRLGGLCGREVSHLTFTRRTPTSPRMLAYYRNEHQRIMSSGGVIVTSPENVMSFKLNGWQLLTDGKTEPAHQLIRLQSFLDQNCRDVIDESDFTLGVKTQLIYPSGAQTSVDGNPWRWEVTEKLLGLIESHLTSVQAKFPTSVLVVTRTPGFPIINFLREEPQDELQERIVDDIANGRTTVIAFASSMKTSKERRKMVHHVLTAEKLDGKIFKRVVRFSADRASAPKILLTARGLLFNRILFLCLRKRWNVQYGLALERCPVAVPFEAKGIPSERAEFGHPDVAISLTCLSFYYQGVNQEQFRDGLRRVLRSDDPAAEYERWVGTTELPDTLASWNHINIEDTAQTRQLWEILRLERTVINHYLNHFVFPIHAKQFEVKLQASAWDIPMIYCGPNNWPPGTDITDDTISNSTKSMGGFPIQPDSVSSIDHDTSQEVNRARTTGFSGTNDNKIVLPSTIQQDDLPGLVHTNAEVLTYLLQPRNRGYVQATSHGARLTENQFLHRLADMEIRILIDAGAYVLEMDNRTLATAWLAADSKAKAAVYFGYDHRIWVKYRGKENDLPLIATPLAEDLSECLVYLDESHTRGVDLKFPANARGALTLALGQTKDHTVQAAMRLRQLATTQSITFFAPLDVHQSLLDTCKLSPDASIDSTHVVYWLLEQTCQSNEDLLGLHFAQGVDFCRRKNAETQYDQGNPDAAHRKAIVDDLRRPESRTLDQLYGNTAAETSLAALTDLRSPLLQGYLSTIAERRSNVVQRTAHQDALEEVEQEREIEFQVEEVREVQVAKPFEALKFPGLHDSLHNFIKIGRLHPDCGFHSIFEMLAGTITGKKYEVKGIKAKVFVSPEFERTVEATRENSPGDDYVRAVDWVLWAPKSNTGVIVIPEEAALFMKMITTNTKIHLLCYAAPVTKRMRHFSTLQYYAYPSFPDGYTPPTWLAAEIGMLGGRMYFESGELEDLKEYLGMTSAEETENTTRFSPDQAGFLLEWSALRRNTRDILHTPMGYVCLGRALTEEHPFFGKGA